jgi:hypothetical protein
MSLAELCITPPLLFHTNSNSTYCDLSIMITLINNIEVYRDNSFSKTFSIYLQAATRRSQAKLVISSSNCASAKASHSVAQL